MDREDIENKLEGFEFSDEDSLDLEREIQKTFMMVNHKSIFMPQPLKKGDKIAFISPASSVKEEYVKDAMARFRERGYEPVLMQYALGHEKGSFSAEKSSRLMDLLNALEDSDIRAIFCTRGGYGCVQLLANCSYGLVARNPKWLIGFSDVSALLAMWYVSDIASIHGPMAKHLATMPDDDPCTNALFNILENGGRFDYLLPSSPYNRSGKATGVLRGGNMAVLNGLAATPYDILDIQGGDQDVILFFEDISEPIYAIERMLWRLNLSGTLLKVKALIFGKFTEYQADKNFHSMEEMIDFWLNKMVMFPIPIVFDFPIGHVDLNYPLTVGAYVELEVTSETVSIRTIPDSKKR